MTFKKLIENYIYTNNEDINLADEFLNAKQVKGDLYKSKEHYFYAPNNKYIAGLSYFSHKYGILYLSITHSIKRGGLLKLLNILPRTKLIISDVNLSLNAFKFWEKIAYDNDKVKVFVDYKDKIIHTFTNYTDIEQKMIKSTDYRIGLKL